MRGKPGRKGRIFTETGQNLGKMQKICRKMGKIDAKKVNFSCAGGAFSPRFWRHWGTEWSTGDLDKNLRVPRYSLLLGGRKFSGCSTYFAENLRGVGTCGLKISGGYLFTPPSRCLVMG